MVLKAWDELPYYLRCVAVRPYYDILVKHRAALLQKRVFDVLLSSILIVVASPLILISAVAIKLDNKGPVFFSQKRITQYGKPFSIYKMRTMVVGADKEGHLVTVSGDSRITRVGKVLRKIKVDEFPQLLNVWKGEMTFVGTRPEVEKYVAMYSEEMMSTLLLPAGITSKASIKYRDEDKMLEGSKDIDRDYVERVLPGKMKYNLEYLKYAGLWYDLSLIVKTAWLVIKRVFVRKDELITEETVKNQIRV